MWRREKSYECMSIYIYIAIPYGGCTIQYMYVDNSTPNTYISTSTENPRKIHYSFEMAPNLVKLSTIIF